VLAVRPNDSHALWIFIGKERFHTTQLIAPILLTLTRAHQARFIPLMAPHHPVSFRGVALFDYITDPSGASDYTANIVVQSQTVWVK